MITEDNVSFETAKLLKEKGFDCNTNCYYIEDFKDLFYSPIRENHNASIKNNEFGIQINISSGKMSAPTLQMAMKWLRKKHNLEIYPFHEALQEFNNWWFRIERHSKSCSLDEYASELEYNEYEDACEAAIKYCLENLI